jgi:hypothetical protein
MIGTFLLKSCPSCHKPFAAKEVKRTMVASDDKSSPSSMAGFPWKNEFPEDYQSPHVHTYRVTYRCRFCRHEWDDLIQWKA